MKKSSLMQTLLGCVLFLSSGIQANPSSQPYTLEIVDPINESTFSSDIDTISVQVKITPELKEGDALKLFVDGEAEGDPVTAHTLPASRLERGSHTLQVKVVSKAVETAESNIVTLYQQRASKLHTQKP